MVKLAGDATSIDIPSPCRQEGVARIDGSFHSGKIARFFGVNDGLGNVVLDDQIVIFLILMDGFFGHNNYWRERLADLLITRRLEGRLSEVR